MCHNKLLLFSGQDTESCYLSTAIKKTTRVASIHSVVGTNVTCWKVARSRERINYNQGLVSIETVKIELTPTHYQ